VPLVSQPVAAVLQKAPPPLAHRGPGDGQLLGDLRIAEPFGRSRHDPDPQGPTPQPFGFLIGRGRVFARVVVCHGHAPVEEVSSWQL